MALRAAGASRPVGNCTRNFPPAQRIVAVFGVDRPPSIRSGVDPNSKGRDMQKPAAFLLATIFTLAPARAQDIAGVEDCSKTSGLDKRTGCFQSNIDFLKKSITKNATDLQQKLSAANAEIGELKRAVAGLQAHVADLQTRLATMQTTIEQLRQPAKKPETKEK